MSFLKYKHLKLKLRVFLAGHSVAMVTYCLTKIIPTCSPVIGQFFDTMIVASIDKEWLECARNCSFTLYARNKMTNLIPVEEILYDHKVDS